MKNPEMGLFFSSSPPGGAKGHRDISNLAVVITTKFHEIFQSLFFDLKGLMNPGEISSCFYIRKVGSSINWFYDKGITHVVDKLGELLLVTRFGALQTTVSHTIEWNFVAQCILDKFSQRSDQLLDIEMLGEMNHLSIDRIWGAPDGFLYISYYWTNPYHSILSPVQRYPILVRIPRGIADSVRQGVQVFSTAIVDTNGNIIPNTNQGITGLTAQFDDLWNDVIQYEATSTVDQILNLLSNFINKHTLTSNPTQDIWGFLVG